MLKLGTVFSGIGAVEHALERLGIQYEIEFACDNGERKLKTSYEDIEKVTRGMTNSERDKYVADLYDKETGINYVEQSYKANYKIDDSKFYQDVKLIDGREYKNKVDLSLVVALVRAFQLWENTAGWKKQEEHYSMNMQD